MAKNWSDWKLEDGARAFVSHMEDCIKGSLSSEAANVVTTEDKVELERALRKLRPAFDELAIWFFDQFRETQPSHAMYGYEKIWELMAAAFVAGSRGTVTESSKNFFKPEISREALPDSGKNAVVESIKVRKEKSKNTWENLGLNRTG